MRWFNVVLHTFQLQALYITRFLLDHSEIADICEHKMPTYVVTRGCCLRNLVATVTVVSRIIHVDTKQSAVHIYSYIVTIPYRTQLRWYKLADTKTLSSSFVQQKCRL